MCYGKAKGPQSVMSLQIIWRDFLRRRGNRNQLGQLQFAISLGDQIEKVIKSSNGFQKLAAKQRNLYKRR